MGRRGLFAVVVVCAAAVGLGVLGWSLWQGRAGGEPVAAAADSAGPATVGVEAQDFAFVLIRTGEVSVLADGSSGVPLALTPQEVFLLRRQPQVVGRWWSGAGR